MGNLATRYWQIGMQNALGTAVDATRRLYNVDGSLVKNVPPSIPDVDTGTYDRNMMEPASGLIEAGGNISCPLFVDQLPELFRMAINSAVSAGASVSGGAYLWTFSPGDLLGIATIEQHDGQKEWQLVDAMVNQMTLNWSITGGDMGLTFDLIGSDKEDEAMTSSLEQQYLRAIQGWETNLYLDAWEGTPGTTAKTGTFIDGNIVVNNNLIRKYFGNNSQKLGLIPRGKRLVTASFTFEFNTEAETEYANYLVPTRRLVQVELGQNKLIPDSGTEKEHLLINLPGLWTGFVVDKGEGTAIVKLDYENAYDPTNAYAFQFLLQNSRAT